MSHITQSEVFCYLNPYIFSGGEHMNKNDLRVVRSKKLIREAFVDLLEESKYKKLTIQDISKRAMINRKTFYNHYESIDTLFLDVLETAFDLLFEGLHLNAPKDYHKTKEDLHRDLHIFLHNVSRHKRLINILLNDASNYEFTKQLEGYLHQNYFNNYVKSNLSEKRKNMPIDLIVNFVTTGYITVIKWYIENSDTYSEEDAVNVFMDLISSKPF